MFDEHSLPIENHIRHLAVLYLTSQVSNLIGGPLVHLAFADNLDKNRPFRTLELDAHTAPMPDDAPSFPLLNLMFDCVSHDEAHLSWLQAMLDGLGSQLAHVQELRLWDMDPYMAIDWMRPLGRMCSLRDLLVSADLPDPIVTLLGSVAAERCDERTGITERELYLPALEQLTFLLMYRDEALFDLVAHSLGRRMDSGSRLPVLCMHMVEDSLQPQDERLFSRVVSSLVSERSWWHWR
ncbi:hypothetical protein EWM64_g2186 [Hericium alpestre]|uniref:Uncharacterized protein n=1 Tax=Hericium alpestre TaxID=135208 RepID=A0A4Z0A654_9AGAM|nr:hypothetical protein EWM64_g2186 [Hericium alpestre]